MVRKVIWLIPLFLCILSVDLVAADPAFVVFYKSGKAVKMISGKQRVLKKGDQLQAGDQISLPEKTQLVLVCSNFSTVQVKEKGSHSIKTLLAKCEKKAESASSAYFEYVWHSFTHAHVAPEKKPTAYMKTYGAASRGRGSLVSNVAVDTLFYHSGALPLYWQPAKPVIMQVFKVPTGGEPIFKTKAGMPVKLDSLALILKPGNYYWDLDGEQQPRRNFLKIYSATSYQMALQKVLAAVPSSAPAEQAYLTAYMFEEKRFLAEALKYYQKALKLDQNNQIYKDALLRFKL